MDNVVLIADDKESVRTPLRMALEGAGFKVLEATNGEEVLRQAIDHKPSAFLLDVNMPDKDGLWACKQLREMTDFKNSPIVMIASRGSKPDIDRALSAGANDYVIKPFPTDLIIKKLERFLKGEELEGAERRGTPRCDVKLDLIWEHDGLTGSVHQFSGSVCNLSVSGIAFRHKPDPVLHDLAYEPHTISMLHPFYKYAVNNNEGENIRLLIDLKQDAPLKALGKFIFVAREGKEELCGVQFTKLWDSATQRLSDFVVTEMRGGLLDTKLD